MKKITNILILGFLLFSLSNCKTVKTNKTPETNAPEVEFDSHNFGKSDFPKSNGVVSDYEFVFSSEELVTLTETIRTFEKKTTNQIAIVSIKSIGTYDDFDTYAIDLTNEWEVGQKKKDNGLSIVFSKTLRKIRISTGIGTQKILTDAFCQEVIDQIMIPEFKNGNYYSGIEKGLAALIVKWE